MSKSNHDRLNPSHTEPHGEGGGGTEMIDEILFRAFNELFKPSSTKKAKGTTAPVGKPPKDTKGEVYKALRKYLNAHRALGEALRNDVEELSGQAISVQALEAIKETHRKASFDGSLYQALVDCLNNPRGTKGSEITKIMRGLGLWPSR